MTSSSRGHSGGVLGVSGGWKRLTEGMPEPHRDENPGVQG